MIAENDSSSMGSNSFNDQQWIKYYSILKTQLKKKNKLTNMSSEVKKRVHALKRLIVAQDEIKSRFMAEVHLLKLKYQKEYEPYFNKQTDIIQGKYEPTKGEYSSSSEEEDVQLPRYGERGEIGLESCKPEPKGIPLGIPDFWLVYMKNVFKFSCIIQPHDEQILRHLSDIRCNRSEEYLGFIMEFHFTPNEWFTNNVLTLKFEEKPVNNAIEIIICSCVDGVDYKLTGCEIYWNEGKKMTENIINVKLEGTEVSSNKTVENESFFNLFNDHYNSTNPERLYFQRFFRQFKQRCNWIIHEALIIHTHLLIGEYFPKSEDSDFPEDYETDKSYLETD